MHHCQNIHVVIPFLQLKYFKEKNSDAQQLFFSLSLLLFVHFIFNREMKNIKDTTLRILIQGIPYWYMVYYWFQFILEYFNLFFYKLGKKITFFIDWGTQKKRYGKLASHKSKKEDSMWKWRVLQMRRGGRNSFTLVFGIRWRWYYVTRKVPCHT